MRPESGDFQEYSGTVFANEAEVECARLLDYYGIRWEYEPHSFPLETDEEGRVVEAFTPDFFLPEQELYLEVTVMKQSLVTRKNRKIRKFRERYPDVKVKLFTRRDFERLGEKYGLNLVS
jgi:hypoxanthine phosphoribosyltransferase